MLPKAKAARPDVPVIMITAYGDAETNVQGIRGWRRGAFYKADLGALRSEIDTRVECAA